MANEGRNAFKKIWRSVRVKSDILRFLFTISDSYSVRAPLKCTDRLMVRAPLFTRLGAGEGGSKHPRHSSMVLGVLGRR